MLKMLLYTGWLIPIPHEGGAQAANIPATPEETAVTVPVVVGPTTLATAVLLLKSEIPGTPFTTVPFSSVMSASTFAVVAGFKLRVAEVVNSPGTCRRRFTGMQVLKLVAGEEALPTLATTPVIPGMDAVARPLASTPATWGLVELHVNSPMRSLIS
jgi:hypothetical protein